MNEARAISTSLIVPVGTQVVLRARKPKSGSTDDYPKGTIAEIIQPPQDGYHSYRVHCADGAELTLRKQEFSILKQVKLVRWAIHPRWFSNVISLAALHWKTAGTLDEKKEAFRKHWKAIKDRSAIVADDPLVW